MNLSGRINNFLVFKPESLRGRDIKEVKKIADRELLEDNGWRWSKVF
jgi:hypothetical protein